MEAKFNHFDHNGNAVMVDVSDKAVTERTAVASGKIRVNDAVMQAILQGTAKKGDVLGVARVAGIMATKQTSSLIPMCHLLCLNKSTIDFEIEEGQGHLYGEGVGKNGRGNGGADGRQCYAADDLRYVQGYGPGYGDHGRPSGA